MNNNEAICQHCYEDLIAHHFRNLKCPDGRVTIFKEKPESVYWNPFNKVVQDHRDGTIYDSATNVERAKRGLVVPWLPVYGEMECRESPSY